MEEVLVYKFRGKPGNALMKALYKRIRNRLRTNHVGLAKAPIVVNFDYDERVGIGRRKRNRRGTKGCTKIVYTRLDYIY